MHKVRKVKIVLVYKLYYTGWPKSGYTVTSDILKQLIDYIVF